MSDDLGAVMRAARADRRERSPHRLFGEQESAEETDVQPNLDAGARSRLLRS